MSLGRDFAVRCYTTGEALLKSLVAGEEPLPRAVLIDLGLKDGISGLELLKTLRGLFSKADAQPKLVIHSGHSDEATVRAVMRWHPDGFICKGDPGGLHDPLREALQDEVPLSAPVRRCLLKVAEEHARLGDAVPAAKGRLSHREIEVLAMAADGANNAKIATALQISERTVETHMSSVYEKLGVHGHVDARREAVAKALRLGLLA